jgi:transposase
MSCWRRLRDWQRAGVWRAFHHALLDRLGRAGLIDWSGWFRQGGGDSVGV